MKTVGMILFLSMQVLCDINNDTVGPSVIYKNFHRSFDKILTEPYGKVYEISTDFSIISSNADSRLKQYLEATRNSILKDNKQIMEELNLSSIQARHCVENNNKLSYDMMLKSTTELELCKAFSANKLQDVKALLNGVYAKQDKQHRALEDLKFLCNSSLPEQLSNCINYELFIVHVNEMRKINLEIKTLLELYNVTYKSAEKNLENCSKVWKNIIAKELDYIVLQFVNCCYHVAEDRGNSIF